MVDKEMLEAISDMMDDKLRGLKEDVSGLKEDVNIMKEDIVRLYDNMDVVQKDIKKLQITQENQIMPILSDLVVCYKDTYDRYRTSVEEHDKMRMDIDVIKIVLEEHDQVIKKIS